MQAYLPDLDTDYKSLAILGKSDKIMDFAEFT